MQGHVTNTVITANLLTLSLPGAWDLMLFCPQYCVSTSLVILDSTTDDIAFFQLLSSMLIARPTCGTDGDEGPI